jgi:hypothetical protein
VISSVISVVIIALFVLLYNEIFAVTFDESFAKATGTKVSVYNMIISALTAVTIVIGMRMMGALLISSLIIFPTVTSMRVCKSYKGVVICSTVVSVFCFLSGLLLSIRHETPTGASVVVVNIFMLGVFSLVGSISKISDKSRFYSVKKLLKMAVCIISVAVFVVSMTFGSFNAYRKDKLTIVATSFAPYDFARQIAGDNAEVIMLLSPGEESHTYEPTPGDIMKIEQCDVFIFGGGESETWVHSVLEGVDKDIRTVKMMDCVSLYEHEEHEDNVLEVGEHAGEFVLFKLRRGDLVEELLNKTEGTEESAYPTAENNAVEQNNSEKIEGHGLSACGKRVLKRAERAGKGSAGAGVAVKSRSTKVFQGTLVDIAGYVALKIRVEEKRHVELDQLSLCG